MKVALPLAAVPALIIAALAFADSGVSTPSGVVAPSGVPAPSGVVAPSGFSPFPTVDPFFQPKWRLKDLGTVDFNYSRDQRGASDWSEYRINERGLINADDLLVELMNAPGPKLYEDLAKANCIKDSYQDFLRPLVEKRLANLILNRIMDNQAMQHKLSPHLSSTRLNYVFRSILAWNAVEKDKVKTRTVEEKGKDGKVTKRKYADEDVSIRSNEQLYQWLRESYANGVRLRVDWMYTDAGLRETMYALKDPGEIQWPTIRIVFAKLPDTWKQFRTELYKKLDDLELIDQVAPSVYSEEKNPSTGEISREPESHRKLMRFLTWAILMQQRFPGSYFQTMVDAPVSAMNEVYEQFKEAVFRIHDSKSMALTVTGAKAGDFAEKLKNAYLAKEKALRTELFGADGSLNRCGENDAAIKAKLVEYRRTLPRQLLESVKQEMAAELTSGAVKLEIVDKSLEYRPLGAGATPTPDDPDLMLKSFVFGQAPEAQRYILPMRQFKTENGDVKIYLVESIDGLTPSYIEKSAIEAKDFLLNFVKGRNMVRLYRRLASDLFRENPFYFSLNVCKADPSWPCAGLDPDHLAGLLFPDQEFDIRGVLRKTFEIPNY